MKEFEVIEINASTPFERGVQYGKAAADKIQAGIANYRAFFEAKGRTWEQTKKLAMAFVPDIEAAMPDVLEEAKGIAEAEALEKKAEAMKKYGQAAMMEMIVKALPEMAAAIAKPMESIDRITIIDGGANGESGVSQMGGYVPNVLAKTIESVKEVTGLDLVEVMKAQTYDAKVNRNINVSGLSEETAKNVAETLNPEG